ncbi:response regulator [Kitasatospora sp. NPDC059795]|uniref:response regulator n=1 Tax=unclassified Kitasatospora TaxID=2633591 RepID=UPI00093C18A3|nr:response regulator transcription factor [Kitasatospora sp. CB01950]OKJ13614.1 LuxR family transcriptional regulator [Kitasatospora sp. CB01950]
MSTAPIRVLIADDEPLVRSGLAVILGAEPDIDVVGEAESGAQAVALARTLTPDVVLTDVRMPALDGIQAARRILDTVVPAPRVVVITTFENDDSVHDALLAGAAGFLLKRSRPEAIVQAVRLAAFGDTLMFPDSVRDLALHRRRATTPFPHPLSEREQDVLRLMASGLGNAEIAATLFLGAETVKTHVANILTKLGARNRTHAVVLAYRSGFVAP